MKELQDLLAIRHSKQYISYSLVLLIFLLIFCFEHHPGSVMITEDDFTQLDQLYGVVWSHFGVEETETIFSDDQILRISVSIRRQEISTGC